MSRLASRRAEACGWGLLVLCSPLLVACGGDGGDTGGGDGGNGGDKGQLTLVAGGIEFLPPTIRSDFQYRATPVIEGGNLYFADSSSTPLKRVPITGGPVTPLANQLGPPVRIAIFGRRVTYTDGTGLWDHSLDTHVSTMVATGNAALTPTLLSDAEADYWVRTVPTQDCSPPCVHQLEKVTADGGTVLLEVRNNRVLALAQDGETLYLEEGD